MVAQSVLIMYTVSILGSSYVRASSTLQSYTVELQWKVGHVEKVYKVPFDVYMLP